MADKTQNPIEEAVIELNKQRLAMLKAGRRGSAMKIQQAMMQTDRATAHRLLNDSKGKTSSKPSTGGEVYGRYRSRSGADIMGVVDNIPMFEPKKKTKTVVTSPHKAVLDHVTANTYAELNDMSDGELDALFKNAATERQWLAAEGARIHRRAKKAVVRRKTRQVLQEAIEAEPQPTLADMTRAELDAVAVERGLNPKDYTRKDEILAALKDEEPPAEPPAAEDDDLLK